METGWNLICDIVVTPPVSFKDRTLEVILSCWTQPLT